MEIEGRETDGTIGSILLGLGAVNRSRVEEISERFRLLAPQIRARHVFGSPASEAMGQMLSFNHAVTCAALIYTYVPRLRVSFASVARSSRSMLPSSPAPLFETSAWARRISPSRKPRPRKATKVEARASTCDGLTPAP
jgi:hypothetical protein